MQSVKTAFEFEGRMLPLDQILALRKLPKSIRQSEKYKCIMASIGEIDIIEPLIVFPQPGRRNAYLLLDGTIRLEILRSTGATEAFCLIATEDEAYTYNHKVNQLTAIQEHFMIMRAIDSGVHEERIAATLNVNVAAIRKKMDLLDGICPEAVTLLKDRKISPAGLRVVRRVVPMRQIEMAELMVASNNYSTYYAKCLLAATKSEQRASGQEETPDGISPEDRSRMECEMIEMRRNFKVIEETHGENALHFVLAVGYLRNLLNNAKVVRFLSQRYAEILAEFQKLIEARSMDVAAPLVDK